MRSLHLKATPIYLEIYRVNAQGSGEDREPDHLDVKAERGNLELFHVDIDRGDLLEMSCEDANISEEERLQIQAVLVAEWASWPVTPVGTRIPNLSEALAESMRQIKRDEVSP